MVEGATKSADHFADPVKIEVVGWIAFNASLSLPSGTLNVESGHNKIEVLLS
jgi:hypothetical protein